MPPKLARVLRDFYDDITKVVTRHFEAYLSGTPTTTKQTMGKPFHLSYAQAAKSRSSVTDKSLPRNKLSMRDKNPQIIVDERLSFVS